VFSAVSDPTRRQILDVLREGEQSVNELVARFTMSQPAVSQHLRVLRKAELVSVHKRGRQRLYRLDSSALKVVFDWTQYYEEFWNERLSRLGEVLDGLPDDIVEETNG
jgi:DNA-binding transcriptional ArsR family regulator